MFSAKTYYALRALFHLARLPGGRAATAAEIAVEQAIPVRFLEAILRELRQAGLVVSRRGAHGGYALAPRPEDVTVEDVITEVSGPLHAVSCTGPEPDGRCPLGDCAFKPMWKRVDEALAGVLRQTTLADLVEDHRRSTGRFVPDYVI